MVLPGAEYKKTCVLLIAPDCYPHLLSLLCTGSDDEVLPDADQMVDHEDSDVDHPPSVAVVDHHAPPPATAAAAGTPQGPMHTPNIAVKEEPLEAPPPESGGPSQEDATTSGGPSGLGSKRARAPSVEPPAAARRAVRARMVSPKEEQDTGGGAGPSWAGAGPSLAGAGPSSGGAGPSGVGVEEELGDGDEEDEEEGSGSDMGEEEDDEETLDQVGWYGDG